ncbi:MAG: hypothetical protein JWN48_26 [Myxococcaceae bacterium]|nr:hypothetical protein [Myxococcaceae bacterium]
MGPCARAWQARCRACVLLLALTLGLPRMVGAQDCTPVIGESSEETCPGDQQAYVDAETLRIRAERRASVASMGTFIALMSAFAVPATFVPQGVARTLRRLHIVQRSDVSRLQHRAYRARVRVLPMLGMTALSVTALSSRFWWAGILTAGCGVSSDVLLTEYWRHGGRAKRGIGIATASVGALAGLMLDLETLAYSDAGAWRAFMPTLKVGVAQVELGIAGRF